jgi:hypothetical protein
MADVEEEVEYEVERKGGAAPCMDNAADRLKAGAKTTCKKVTDRYRYLETEYNLGKAKERLASFFFYCT